MCKCTQISRQVWRRRATLMGYDSSTLAVAAGNGECTDGRAAARANGFGSVLVRHLLYCTTQQGGFRLMRLSKIARNKAKLVKHEALVDGFSYYTVLVCLSCTEMKCSTRASTHKPRFILYGECQAILEAVRAIKMIMTLMMRRMTSMATREMIAVAISIMIK
ncbi:uncharacterized protein LOC125530187 isoform X2 [Triticum urartu]|uniref:uncharacterized protein LOC125530187 isoform X2 n=1 Tax=Triticum urartu TaxID=4572 RepID=UPI002043E95B|nr:uncharacterized protein LOC125530187 isoform X2 [Triticum urartu]